MKIYSLFFLLFLFLQDMFAQNKNICVTVDDLPVVSYGMNDSTFQRKLMDGIINSLKKHNIPAIGFADFTQDVLKGELITKQILADRNKSLKYFRHPFLHIGNTKEKYDSLTNFLKSVNYITAPVTIDNEDYIFAVAYKRAKEKNDLTLTAKIGRDYIAYMENKLHYFENQSQKLFGKNINHILLMHASWLNSDYIDSLAIMLKKNDYNFISLDETLRDELYQTEITKFGNWGISWLDIWALSQGKKGDFFKDEPQTPDYIKKLAE
jgi:hypothetical protein